MDYPTIIPILIHELKDHKRSKEKSIQSYLKGDIDVKTHQTHIRNLNKLISEYENAIKKLTN